MIDTGISPKVSSPDTNSYASTSAGAGKNEGTGFYETLSNVGQHSQKAGSDAHKSASDAPKEHEAGAEAQSGANNAEGTVPEDAVAEEAPRAAKPIVDIRYRSPLHLAKLAGEQALQAGMKDAAVETKHTDLPADGTKTKSPLDALAEAETPAVKGRATATASGASHGKTGEAGKTDKVQTKDEAAAAEATDSSLGEVLNLLSTGAGEAPAAKTSADAKTKSALDKNAVDPNGAASRKDVAGGVAAGLKSIAGAADHDTDMPEGETDGADQAFRLVRADGKGQAIQVKGGAEAGEAQAERASAAKDSGPTVTILDARRFLAPVSDTNAANISAAFLGDSSWVEAMHSSSALDSIDQKSGAGKVVNTLKIQMTPIELGLVTASLRLSGETLSIQLTVESPAAMRKLTEDSSEIIKALKAQGFAVDQIQINVAPSGRADSDASGSQQQQSSGQQMAQGGQGNGANGQRQDTGSPASAREFGNAMGIKTDEAVATQGPQGGSDGTRPGHVYI